MPTAYRNRRRTGYIFMAEHDRHGLGRVKAMSYSLEEAMRLLEANGYYNFERIVKQTIQPAQRNRFRVDRNALNEAKRILGIEWPVVIRTHGRSGGCNGNYHLDKGRDGKPCHNIMLKDWRSAEEANGTLWHELTHAMQAEREAKRRPNLTPWEAWKRYREGYKNRRISYKDKPWEVEARASSERYKGTLLIAKPRHAV